MEAVAGPSGEVVKSSMFSDLIQDEEINRQLSEAASDDEEIQFVVPIELVSSLILSPRPRVSPRLHFLRSGVVGHWVGASGSRVENVISHSMRFYMLYQILLAKTL